MGKAPAFQFYASDWLRDMTEHPIEIEGAWVRTISKMWFEPERGKMTRPDDVWARIWGVSVDDAKRIISHLSQKIADFQRETNGDSTLINRRMYREYLEQLNSRSRYQRYADKRKTNADSTVPSSSSSSTSSSNTPYNPPLTTKQERPGIVASDIALDRYWKERAKRKAGRTQ